MPTQATFVPPISQRSCTTPPAAKNASFTGTRVMFDEANMSSDVSDTTFVDDHYQTSGGDSYAYGNEEDYTITVSAGAASTSKTGTVHDWGASVGYDDWHGWGTSGHDESIVSDGYYHHQSNQTIHDTTLGDIYVHTFDVLVTFNADGTSTTTTDGTTTNTHSTNITSTVSGATTNSQKASCLPPLSASSD